MGVYKLKIFGQIISFHILAGLARQLIFGYDLMKEWKAIIDIRNRIICLLYTAKSPQLNMTRVLKLS
jgi:hypothetical protein